MDRIPLPTKVQFEKVDAHHTKVIIEPCYPGYGTTLGNALRRILLSSLPGAAVSAVKFSGVQHEFSSIPGVKEDIVDLLLNIKQLRVKLHEGDNAVLTLAAKGEKVVRAEDIILPSNAEIANPDLVLATLTDKSAELTMELTVESGRGYVPVEARTGTQKEIGVISVDAVFTPVRNVNFDTENVRVGQMTNYDRLTVDIATDGTMTPEDAYAAATEILVEHFVFLSKAERPVAEAKKEKRPAKKAKKETP